VRRKPRKNIFVVSAARKYQMARREQGKPRAEASQAGDLAGRAREIFTDDWEETASLVLRMSNRERAARAPSIR
jgi:hypothetical protein